MPTLVDTLSLGLAYVAGSARVGGAAVEPTVTGDGVSTPQTLTWAGGIDIPEGTTVTVTYDVTGARYGGGRSGPDQQRDRAVDRPRWREQL